jgi:hypothetical protein
VLEAIEDRGADRPHVGAETARFLHFLPLGHARPVVRLAVIAHLAKGKFLFGSAQDFLEPQLEKVGIAREAGLGIDAIPGGMHVPLAGRLIDVKTPRA